MAINKGWRMKSGGEGLILPDGKAIRTEKDILEKLLGKYVEPEQRS